MALLQAPADHAQKKACPELVEGTGHAAEQDRPDVLSRREAWFEGQLDLDPHTLVFIAPAPRWPACMGEHPVASDCGRRSRTGTGAEGQRRRRNTTTFVGALRLTGMTAPMVLDGPMTGEWFLAYTEQVLVPTLRPGDVVILDSPVLRPSPATAGSIVASVTSAADALNCDRPSTCPRSSRRGSTLT